MPLPQRPVPPNLRRYFRVTEIDRRLTEARPRLPRAPSLPWTEALIGLAVLMLLQAAG
ncbi:hypothetical protein [Szabonella alba]|uniref:Uncharacterized protein n=1 Tax=Szabonella alba TaxID=2804194 RepID=A0A8K0VBM3_9RHOB|nr:hypothetical protein [Szabonella alba]MBL4917263.1 hypothetical protein [Szabonella alba]